VMPAAVAYYLTVASADNWAGAVCNLGRYFMPVAPLAVALVAVALSACHPEEHRPGRATKDPQTPADPSGHGPTESLGMTGRGVLALVLMLAAWTGLFAVALWRDPHAASDSALLLAKSAYADGNQYIPNLFIRRWADAAPGLWARIAAWLLALGAIAWWLRRVAVSARRGREHRGASPVATLAAVAALVLSAAVVLERWPGRRDAPSFGEALAIPGESATPLPMVFVSGAARVRLDEAVLGPGAVDLLLRAPAAVPTLTVTVGGQGGVLRPQGLPPVVLRPTGALVSLPFVPYHVVRGHEGHAVAFTRARLIVTGEAVLRLGERAGARPDASPGPGGETEPEAGEVR